MGAEIDRLELQVEAQATKANNQLDKLVGKLDAVANSLSHINTSGLTGLANGVQKFAQASSQLSSVKTTDFTRLTKNIEKLSALNTQQIFSTSSAITTLSKAVGNLSGNAGTSTQVAELANGIGKLGGANVQKAVANLPVLASALNDFMTTMSNAPAVSRNVIRMTDALADLAAQGNRVGAAGRGLTQIINNAGNSEKIGRFTNNLKGISFLLRDTYRLYALFQRAAGKVWTSIDSSMSYVETLNYFDAAYGQVAEKAVSQWADMGAASAEEYYNSFSRRAKELTSKMTGFSVNDDGTLTATGQASLGINPNQLMNYQAMFAQMSSSMGIASETSLKLSQVLTEIGGDLASVKNMDFDKVWQDMASGLAGMSRTLDKYGVNIRNVNLQEKLMELGIEENITALNQNDKALLRAIILLDSTRYAWGDLADTINQPANQIRLLESNWANLSRTIGNIFLPMVAKVLPYVNGLVIAVQRLFTWIGSLLGLDLSQITSTVGSSEFDFGDLISDTDDLTGSLNDASKAADKLKKGIRAFDELNVITTKDDSDSSALSGLGGIGTTGLLNAAFDDIFNEYQSKWDETFAKMENKANEIADKIEQFFQPLKDIFNDFAVGDFFKAGQDTSKLVAGIFNFFADAIDNVDWYGIGQKVGDFIAGLDWFMILKSGGRLFWEAFKAVLEFWAGSFSAAPLETTLISALALSKLASGLSRLTTSSGKLGKALAVAKDSFWALKTGIADGDFLGGANLAIENIRNNLSPLGKVAITAAAGFAEFKVINKTAGDLVKGTENIGVGLAKIGGAATLASGAMYVALGPTGLAAGAITGLVAGLLGIDNAFIEIRKQAMEKEEIEKYGDTLENIGNIAHEVSGKLMEASDARLALVSNIGEVDVSYIETLKDKYYELSEKIGLSADEQAELQLVSEKLVGYLPELQNYYDSTTGLLDVQRETLEELITQKEKELMLSAISDQWESAIKDRITAQKKLKEYTDGLTSATDELAIAYAEVDEYKNSFADPNMANLQDYQEKITELTAAVETYTTASIESKEALSKINGEIDDYTQMYEEWSNDFNRLGNDAGAGYAKGIEEAADDAIKAARELTGGAVEAGADEQESNSPSKRFEELGKYAVDGYNLGITENQDTTKNIISTYISDIISQISQLVDSFNTIGENAMQGLYNGLSSMETQLYEKAQSIADNIAGTVKTSLDIHSPSRVMFSLGEFTMEGFQLGMENMYDSIRQSISLFGDGIQYEIAGLPQTNYDLYLPDNTPDKYSNNTYYENTNNYDSAETNMLLRELISVVREGSTIEIDGEPIFKKVMKKNNEAARLNHAHMLTSY